MATFSCSSCRKSVEAASGKPPRGWKREGESVACAKCFASRWAIRAVEIPIAGPVVVEGGQEAIRAEWQALRAALKKSWGDCTRVANWLVRELAKAEPPRGEKLAPLPVVYSRPGARELAPDLSPESLDCLRQAVEARYRKRRYDAIHRCAESLPSYRYPTPLPLHNRSWRVSQLPGGALAVSVRIGGDETGRRFLFRLRGGFEYARQTAALRALLAGEARQCEAAIRSVPARRSDHRPGMAVEGAFSRVLVKFVLWMPIRESVREGTLYLRTARDCLLTWSFGVGKDDDAARAFRYNADHVRRWVAEHRNRLQRTSDDLKHENRWPKKVREAQVEAREPWVAKFGNRMDSLTHEASAMIARVAERTRVERVVYDDSERGFVESFPWADLKTKLEYKLKTAGIAFEEAAACPTISEPVGVATASGTAPSSARGPKRKRSTGSRSGSA